MKEKKKASLRSKMGARLSKVVQAKKVEKKEAAQTKEKTCPAPVGAGTGRAPGTGWPPPWSSQFGKYNRSGSPGKKWKM